jgi:hypothetical protein
MRRLNIGVNNGVIVEKVEGSINFHRASGQSNPEKTQSPENTPMRDVREQRSDSFAVKLLQEMYEPHEVRRLLQLDFPDFANQLPSGGTDSDRFFGELILAARRYNALPRVLTILERERTAQHERFAILRRVLKNP